MRSESERRSPDAVSATPDRQDSLSQSGQVCIMTLYWTVNTVSTVHIVWPVALCEYSKFRIESNSYFSIRFNSKRAQLFEIFEYLPSPISYLFNRMKPIFHLINHA